MRIIKFNVLLIVLIITYYSLKFPDGSTLPTNDKVGHSLAYLSLSLNLFLLCSSKSERLKAVLFLISYGVLMEIIQGFIPGRDSSINDMIANSTGIGAGLIIIYFFQKRIITFLKKIKIIS
jgi:VanZ family protein